MHRCTRLVQHKQLSQNNSLNFETVIIYIRLDKQLPLHLFPGRGYVSLPNRLWRRLVRFYPMGIQPGV